MIEQVDEWNYDVKGCSAGKSINKSNCSLCRMVWITPRTGRVQTDELIGKQQMKLYLKLNEDDLSLCLHLLYAP